MAFDRCFGCMRPKTDGPMCMHCGYDGKQNNSSHQLPVGTILQGTYLVGRVLGQGGFGITYLGWDLSLEIPIAIKEYYPNGFVVRDCSHSLAVTEYEGKRHTYFQNSRARFLREAKALARFSEIPEIVHVRNFFEENNTAYIVMEYVKGVELRHYVQTLGGTIGVEETLSILEPVMKALSIVHKADLIHRDISPDNIMLLPDGGVKLLDFGAVRDVENADAEKDLTKSTEAILKHGFAPMEQYQKRGALGPWTDIYALCATAYFCLTGQIPPDAPARMMDDIHPDWKGIPNLSSTQRAAFEKGMEMLAKDRTASIQQLQEQLFPKKDKTEEQKKKKSGPLFAAVAATILLVGGVAGYLVHKQSQNEVFLQIPQNTVQTETQVAVTQETAETECTVPESTTIQTIPTTAAPTEEPTIEQTTETTTTAIETTEALPVPEETEPPRTYSAYDWAGNELMYSVPPSSLQDITTHSVFGSAIPRNKIGSITFLDSKENAPASAWDASKARNRSVLAWVEENGDLLDLYIAGHGGVNAVSCTESLFAGYCNVKTITLGSAFHIDNCYTLERMFYGCSNLQSVDVDRFNTSNVLYFTDMFYGCYNLRDLDVSGFDTSKATEMSGMFAYCSSLPQLDVSGFVTKRVTDMSYMFTGCSNVPVLDVSGFNTARVTSFAGMFSDCSKVEVLDVSGFDTSKATTFNSMFSGCSSVKELDVTGFKTYSAMHMSNMFSGCSSLERLDTSSFTTKNCISMSAMFNNCSSLKELNVSSLRTGQNRSLAYMFNNCSSLESLDISKFSTENTTSMAYMFNNCSSLKELDVSNLSTYYVTDMSHMFHNCSGLETLDVTNFMTYRVTDMSYMFYKTVDWVEIDFTKFNTDKVRNYEHFMNDGIIMNGRYWEDMFR